MIQGENGEKYALPSQVKEHDTTKTSVYRAGELVYDGATGQGVGREARNDVPGGSLNEMLKWSIENSDPAELAKRAGQGARPPTQIDKEIMDMLLGQPTVAKMRECTGKLTAAALCADGGLDEGTAALEELEFYVEDLDNAIDLVKIRGLQIMKSCCGFGLLEEAVADSADADTADGTAPDVPAAAAADPEGCAALREAACGVLAAMIQNNPKVAKAAHAAGLHFLLLFLLGGGSGTDEARVGGIAVVRKALLALSALLRTSTHDPNESAADRTLSAAAEAAAAPEAGADSSVGGSVLQSALPTLCALCAHSDLKVRRRTLFLLASLSAQQPVVAAAIAAVAGGTTAASGESAPAAALGASLVKALLGGLASEDEDVRVQCQKLHESIARLSTGAAEHADAARAMAARLQREGGTDAVGAALKAAAAGGGALAAADEKAALADEATRLQVVANWLDAAA